MFNLGQYIFVHSLKILIKTDILIYDISPNYPLVLSSVNNSQQKTDSGKKAETIQLGTSTISLIFKSTQTEQST